MESTRQSAKMTRNKGHGIGNDFDIRQFSGMVADELCERLSSRSPIRFGLQNTSTAVGRSAATSFENNFAIEQHQQVVPVTRQGYALDRNMTCANNTPSMHRMQGYVLLLLYRARGMRGNFYPFLGRMKTRLTSFGTTSNHKMNSQPSA